MEATNSETAIAPVAIKTTLIENDWFEGDVDGECVGVSVGVGVGD